MESIKKYVAEFIGTFVLVLFACGAAVVSSCAAGNVGHLLTALAFGLVIVAMAYSVGNVSGCHINPAVSMGMLVAGKMSVKDFIGYVISQFLGAIAGAAVLAVFVGVESGLGTNNVHMGAGVSFLAEVLLTFVFVFAILGVTSKESNGSVAGIVIGLTLVLVHLFGIPLTGT
ncbi:MAG: aquaporin, partial [Treponema sp.]|nr:aquaporin [Candidatus Treponema equifaecale]